MNSPESRRVRDAVYRTFAAEGRAPSVAELARTTGSTADRVQSMLHQLADAHALVLTSDGDAIRMAHPFSAAPMAFVVTPTDGRDERRWWGGCAWDSFGISAALDLDVRIDTTCPNCAAHLAVQSPSRGYVTDARTVWDLVQAWYGDRLAPDFQPHTREHNQALLAERGLTGDFWRLP